MAARKTAAKKSAANKTAAKQARSEGHDTRWEAWRCDPDPSFVRAETRRCCG